MAIVAASLAFGGVLAAAGWFAWFPHYRPKLHPGETYGVDVSAHQGSIDWQSVARDDVRFAYIKATEGGDYVDSRFKENWDAAGRAGLERGAYHFFTLCRPGIDQATNFLEAADQAGELAPAVDLEFGGNCADRPTRAHVFSELDAYLDRVESTTGRKVTVYVLDDFNERYDVSARYQRLRWVRRIPLRPGGEWTLWQFTGVGRVNGIDGAVDINVLHAGR